MTPARDSVLTSPEITETARWIASIQRRDGLICWTPGGSADPWNLVEAAMALDVAGLGGNARRAYDHLLGRQRSDGAFPVDLTSDDAGRIDTNTVAYLGVGLLHHALSSGGDAFARRGLPQLERAITFVLDHRIPGGAVSWNVDPDGSESPFALVAGSSSIALSLRCAARLAEISGWHRPSWSAAASSIAASVRERTSLFLDKSEFAMDWYYPVLAGVVTGREASTRIDAGRGTFWTPDGIRCRSDGRWVTTAETAEGAIAHLLAGDLASAHALLRSVADKRRSAGGYLTGLVYPERSEFPKGEETTYSAAAVLLASDLAAGGRATRAVFASDRTRTRRVPHAAPVSSVYAPDPSAST